MKVLSLAIDLIPRPLPNFLWQSNIEYLVPVIGWKVVFCLHHWIYYDFVNNIYVTAHHKISINS